LSSVHFSMSWDPFEKQSTFFIAHSLHRALVFPYLSVKRHTSRISVSQHSFFLVHREVATISVILFCSIGFFTFYDPVAPCVSVVSLTFVGVPPADQRARRPASSAVKKSHCQNIRSVNCLIPGAIRPSNRQFVLCRSIPGLALDESWTLLFMRRPFKHDPDHYIF